ncbi:hypothetical protein [Dactylosporangium sp. NPDC050588]|uniref:hypothetical protein n=1 Tax=Dactylosporangium sp. NPDC050588 TaxID=3157211 RepID=UPI0033D05FEB
MVRLRSRRLRGGSMSIKGRWLGRVLLAGFCSLLVVGATPSGALAALALTADVPNNTFSPWTWSFNVTVPRWNVVFVHPYQGGDEDLSITRAGVRLAQTGSTQVSEQASARMDFIALNNHYLPLGAYTANTTTYSGSPAYQIIFRQSAGTITPHPFNSPARFVAASTNAKGYAMLGTIYDLQTQIGQDLIISADTPGGVFLVADYATMPIPTPVPPVCCVRISAISRWLSLEFLKDSERCIRVSGDGSLRGLVVLFRDGPGDAAPPTRRFNVEYATTAQAESRGCRWATMQE